MIINERKSNEVAVKKMMKNRNLHFESFDYIFEYAFL